MNRMLTFGEHQVYISPPGAVVPVSGLINVAKFSCRNPEAVTRVEPMLRAYLSDARRPRFVAQLYGPGQRLVGFFVLRRPADYPYVLIDAKALHHDHAELGFAALTLGLATWLTDRSMQPWRAKGVNRAALILPAFSDQPSHEQALVSGWRPHWPHHTASGGLATSYWLCAAYNLNPDSILSAVRNQSLSRS